MPLETAPVGSPGFGRNVATEIKAGKPEKQAVAIAYSKADERQDAVDIEKLQRERLEAVKAKPNYNGKAADIKRLELRIKEAVEAKSSRKDSTELASHDPLNAKLDAVFKLADALFERADSVSRRDANRTPRAIEHELDACYKDLEELNRDRSGGARMAREELNKKITKLRAELEASKKREG